MTLLSILSKELGEKIKETYSSQKNFYLAISNEFGIGVSAAKDRYDYWVKYSFHNLTKFKHLFKI